MATKVAKSLQNAYRTLVSVALVTGGLFQLAAPVFALGTAAGTTINNTSTATYEDSNNPGTPINATSNTVTITVAEVAGIGVVGGGINDVNGGTIQTNDIVNFDFTVTNSGNDATTFFIPSTATVVGGTQGTIQFIITNPDGTTSTTNVAAGGTATPSIPAGGTVKVRVPVTVTASDGQPISVTLGNTPTVGDQSIATDTGANDVRTVDNLGTAGGDASAAAPANGEREASAVQSTTAGTAPQIFNGPNNNPAAVGPTDNNDDFTNRTTSVPSGLSPTSSFDPAAVIFNNTVQNSSATDPLTNLSFLPTPPAVQTSLPTGTLVTITVGTDIATYSYDSSTGVFTWVSGTNTSPTDPPEIASLAPGATANYTVEVNLPANTPQLTAYPVPVTAFEDTNNDGLLAATESKNTTIDKLYTGFLRLVKESRIIQGSGPAVVGADGAFSSTPKTPAPGNLIEYQITYTNISDPAPLGGSGNTTMNASILEIQEDGTGANGNWALDNDGNGTLDTSNVPNSASASAGSISYFSGAGANVSTTAGDLNVTKYLNILPQGTTIAPGTSGTFGFQRQVN